MAVEPKWVEDPRFVETIETKSHSPWIPVLMALKQRPGVWAEIADTSTTPAVSSLASNIRKAKIKGLQEGEFEAVARMVGDKRVLFARYVGVAASKGADS